MLYVMSDRHGIEPRTLTYMTSAVAGLCTEFVPPLVALEGADWGWRVDGDVTVFDVAASRIAAAIAFVRSPTFTVTASDVWLAMQSLGTFNSQQTGALEENSN